MHRKTQTVIGCYDVTAVSRKSACERVVALIQEEGGVHRSQFVELQVRRVDDGEEPDIKRH